ncbi:S1 family peptidase [Nocardiopsis suaedae]|uniref:S1 family peptidase n=1 Tax=Nocardiopsis suaedae TaxID=3018444 RepID=A0ABT4TLS8_9ACTN|nr:S1 family peptidase [Nocardiopsis suaedae]MDA2805340.1 S1 family peptidase [Nocardiopsis suaedae]
MPRFPRTSPALRLLGGAALVFGLLPATATAAQADAPSPAAPPEQIDAMQRDLGLTEAEALDLMDAEAQARSTESELRDELGDDFGGAVFDIGTATLTVQVTDADAAGAVRGAGAEPQVVDRGEAGLGAVMDTLDASAGQAGPQVHGWYADTSADTVVITAGAGEGAAAEAFAEAAGVPADAVRVEEEAAAPRPLADIVGGTPYYFEKPDGWYVCSVGFPVEGGYVTAGHCGAAGSTTWQEAPGTTRTGTVAESVFPGQDAAWVRTEPGFAPVPRVSDHSGGTVTVTGSQEAPVGASVCRSGQTTGWHCGTVQAKDQTVNYAEGAVHGLTRTSACAEGGDSGGSWLSGTEAQGVTSGGSGDCTSGGTTYFQPLGPVLSQWDLTLLTG